MCEQCVAEAKLYVGLGESHALPGIGLVRATKDGWLMKNGDWGLVHVNDPDYWWSATPVEDPFYGLTDDEINKLPASVGDSFDAACDQIDDALAGRGPSMLDKDCHAYPRFDDAMRLYEAAKQAGYEQSTHGRFAAWLCHHLAVFLKTASALEEPSETPEQQS